MPFTNAAALAVAAMLCLASQGSTARAADPLVLEVASADARFAVNPFTGERADTFRAAGRFPSLAAVQNFDGAADALQVTLSGIELLAGAPPYDGGSLRVQRRRGQVRRVTWSVRGPAGSAGSRALTVNARTGAFRLVIRRADLSAVRDAGPQDAALSVTLGAATADATLAFTVRMRGGVPTWHHRSLLVPVPPPTGPLAFTALAAGSLPGVPRPAVEIAHDATELAALWTALGNPSALPAVDFEREMVVVVSASVLGPGSIPPGLMVDAVRGTGSGIEADWRLALCEEPNQCPGAPDPVVCPSATPWMAVRTALRQGGATLRQLDTVWVCP